MSYTRHYSDTIYETVHISASYPASQNGGSHTLSKTISIPVNVTIYVETTPFDRSVGHCGENVDLLTEAVVATESATILSKHRNSRKVADTIVNGFFSYVKSEISQQISEITQKLDAQLMHIHELSKACVARKKQMEGDYNRITSRYIKIFEDLNNELANRIHQLDKPVFGFKREGDKQRLRAFSGDMATTVSVFGKENSDLQTKICISIAKRRTFDTLNKVRLFLWQQKRLASTIRHSMLNESKGDNIFAPVCFVEFKNNENRVNKNIYFSDQLAVLNEQANNSKLFEMFSSDRVKWDKISPADQKNLNLYFNKELNTAIPGNDEHSTRVREMIQSLSRLGSINTIN